MVEASEGKPLERIVLKQEANRLIGKTKEILRRNSDFAKAVLARFLDNPNLGAKVSDSQPITLPIKLLTEVAPYQTQFRYLDMSMETTIQ